MVEWTNDSGEEYRGAQRALLGGENAGERERKGGAWQRLLV
jgi:hypothetical protein